MRPLQLRLVHENGLESTSWYTATSNNNDWSLYLTTNDLLYGRYELFASSQDNIGNELNQENIGTVTIDGRDPYADVAMNTDVITDGAFIFYGAAYDIPYPFINRILHLHFEDNVAFYDSSGDALAVGCTHCPTAGQSGVSGNGRGF